MKNDPTVSATLQSPTRVRYGVLGFACALSMITYLDRVCFGAAASNIIKDMGLTGEEPLKWAFTAFAFAYAAFEVPSGWLGDVYGPRRTLIRIVLWWSFFTAVTGLIGLPAVTSLTGKTIMLPLFGQVMLSLALLIVIRFLFGMGEAGAYPNITRALYNWFPFSERGMTQGFVWMSGRLMGGLTPLVWAVLVSGVTFSVTENGQTVDRQVIAPMVAWQYAFMIFGVLGLGWCVLFAMWFRNRPEEKETVNSSELAHIRAGSTNTQEVHSGVPWGELLRSTNLWLVCLMYFCAAYGWYFNITYLHKFLEEQFDVKASDFWGTLYKGGPLWMGAAGCLIGGFLTDRYIRRTGNRKMGRRLFGIVGHSLCSVCYLACIYANTAFTFFLAISLAAFCNDLTMGSSWATCQDIGRRYSAIVAGCMNTIGNMGGAVAGFATGYLIELAVKAEAVKQGVDVAALSKPVRLAARLEGYHLNFAIFAAVYVVAVLCWLKIDSTKPVATDA